MNCPKCGTPNPNGNAFCNVCGTPLQVAAPQPQYQQPQPQYQQPQQYQQPYGQPQPGYQQPYGQQYIRPRAPFQWYDASLPLLQRMNRSALEAVVAYFLCMLMPIVSASMSGISTGLTIFSMGAIPQNWANYGGGKFIAMWILDIIFILGTIAVSVLGIHLGTTIGGGCLFIVSLLTLIFSGVDAGKMGSDAHVGIGAIFTLILSLAITGLGVWEFLKFQKKQKGIR